EDDGLAVATAGPARPRVAAEVVQHRRRGGRVRGGVALRRQGVEELNADRYRQCGQVGPGPDTLPRPGQLHGDDGEDGGRSLWAHTLERLGKARRVVVRRGVGGACSTLGDLQDTSGEFVERHCVNLLVPLLPFRTGCASMTSRTSIARSLLLSSIIS